MNVWVLHKVADETTDPQYVNLIPGSKGTEDPSFRYSEVLRLARVGSEHLEQCIAQCATECMKYIKLLQNFTSSFDPFFVSIDTS